MPKLQENKVTSSGFVGTRTCRGSLHPLGACHPERSGSCTGRAGRGSRGSARALVVVTAGRPAQGAQGRCAVAVSVTPAV